MAKRLNQHLQADGVTPKPGFSTWGRALHAKFLYAAKSGASLDALTVYECKHCPKFHVGHSRPRKGTVHDRSR